MKTEYAIWGKTQHSDGEILLSSRITSETLAKRIVSQLSKKYGCREVRIQRIDGSPIDWRKTVNVS